jgi:antitoxin ParD1/3/4
LETIPEAKCGLPPHHAELIVPSDASTLDKNDPFCRTWKLAIFDNPGNMSSRSKGAPPMPTRNVNLTDELDHFVLQKVESGRYENASEVVGAALRTLQREEHRHEAKLAALRTAIDEGDASGIA